MSEHNRVSGTLLPAESQKINIALDDILNSLPFLINLTVEDRKTIRKKGPKSAEYVNLNLHGSQTFPKILKVDFDAAEFKKDVLLYNELLPLSIKIQALNEAVNDTLMAVGADAMKSSDEVYGQLKLSAKKDANVKSLVDQIAKRYAAQSKPRAKKEKV